jgi:hypothetical protein
VSTFVKVSPRPTFEVVEVAEVVEVTVVSLAKMIEVVKVMEPVDKNEVRSDEERRSRIPGIGVRIGRDRIRRHVAVRAFYELPRAVALQAGTSNRLLHGSVDFRLPCHRAAIVAVIGAVDALRYRGRG